MNQHHLKSNPTTYSAPNLSFEQRLIKQLPALRRYALHLSRCGTQAEDLLQDTCIRALRYQTSFKSGTNMSAWLKTIMRNYFFDTRRKEARYVVENDGLPVESHIEHPGAVAEIIAALDCINSSEKKLLTYVATRCPSYRQAALDWDVPIGTIKSRLSRARKHLRAQLNGSV